MGKSRKNEKKTKKKHKHKERKEKKKSKKKNQSKHKIKGINTNSDRITSQLEDDKDFSIPLALMNSKSHAPETPEEYQKRQGRIRREIDPVTGRTRLVKGDGEVLEEIVSKDRQKIINREATKGDGAYFENNTLGKLR